MYIEWDSKKAAENLKKHRVSFEEASSVFFDPLAKVASDPDHSSDEDRYIIIGHSHQSNLLFVIHAIRENGEVIRIISARKATKRERHDFEKIK